jgi:striatin 1/3/4
MYLMLTPANPQPPRESPPLPMMEDLREVDAFGNPGPQPMERQYPIHQGNPQNHVQGIDSRQHQVQNHTSQLQHPPNFLQKGGELQPQPMVRSSNEHQGVMYPTSNDWNAPVSVSSRPLDDNNVAERSHAVEVLGGMDDSADFKDKPATPAPTDTDGWEFPEGTFPEPGPAAANSNRPDTDIFPNADNLPKSPNRILPGSHRRKGSMSRKRSAEHEAGLNASQKAEGFNFKLRFGLRGHLDTVRTVIFSGGGSPGEPEICTAGDDGMIKRFHIPRLDGHNGAVASGASDLDVVANFTHRGHSGAVLTLTSWSPSPNFSTGGRAQGDGWIFSGGQDATIRVWERGRVDPKATLEGHTDAVWAVCVLPTTLGSVFGNSSPYGSTDRILLVSGGADGSVRLWSVSAPPQLSSPQPGSNRGATGRGGRVRGNSMSSGSGFSNTPQASIASTSPFNYTLVHNIARSDGSKAGPTSITPLGPSGESFVVSYSDAAIIVYDTKTGEQVGHMDSLETYDGSPRTSVNSVVATTAGLDHGHQHPGLGEEENSAGGPTGGGRSMTGSGVEGTIISGHEDRFIRFFDANSGKLRRILSYTTPHLLTIHGRPMYIQHAGSPRRHLQPLPQPRRPRARQCRARRLPALLESREALLHAGDDVPSRHARRGCLLGCLEPGRQVGCQRWRRRRRQGVCAVADWLWEFGFSDSDCEKSAALNKHKGRNERSRSMKHEGETWKAGVAFRLVATNVGSCSWCRFSVIYLISLLSFFLFHLTSYQLSSFSCSAVA